MSDWTSLCTYHWFVRICVTLSGFFGKRWRFSYKISASSSTCVSMAAFLSSFESFRNSCAFGAIQSFRLLQIWRCFSSRLVQQLGPLKVPCLPFVVSSLWILALLEPAAERMRQDCKQQKIGYIQVQQGFARWVADPLSAWVQNRMRWKLVY